MLNLKLVIPQKEDLWFKKAIKEDPHTMDYNAGYDLSFNGYNREDGTIKTDIKELQEVRLEVALVVLEIFHNIQTNILNHKAKEQNNLQLNNLKI